MIKFNAILLSLFLIWPQCSNKPVTDKSSSENSDRPENVIVGAEQLNLFVPKLRNKSVALVVNHTSVVGKTHLADTLKSLGVSIKKVFAPEHGFRGAAPDGEKIKDAIDTKTGLPIVSLYGANRKPTTEQLADVDVVIFDIQDVGARFYTYISTMHYVMEACAEQGKKLIILDRPNPNGYVDGPVLKDTTLRSFVGMHPIPTVHGNTVGELAHMINGEGWLKKGVKCDVEVVKIKNWTHNDPYSLVIKPSPNLPNDQAIKLYPSLCLFEGTSISVGRGTQTPFLILGNPLLTDLPYQFTPVEIANMSVNPPHKNKLCYGIDLRNENVERKMTLKYLLDMYKRYPEKEKFFISSFERLAGTRELRNQIISGMTEEQIKATWQKDLDDYTKMRSKYLLYP
jgi:uncharacterized protein YbbC (DUF1343 family)